MKIDEMQKDDAVQATQWFSRRIGAAFPADWMPGSGLAARDDSGRLLCVAVLYLEKSSPVAVFGWVIGDPGNGARENAEAVRLLLAAMPPYAKSKGATHLISLLGGRGMNRQLDRMGFLPGDKNVTQKYKRLR